MTAARRIVSGTFYEPQSFETLQSMVAFMEQLLLNPPTSDLSRGRIVAASNRKLAVDLAEAIAGMADSRIFTWDAICGDVFTWMMRHRDWTIVWSTGHNPHMLLYSISAKELSKRATKVASRFKDRLERRGWIHPKDRVDMDSGVGRLIEAGQEEVNRWI